MDIDIATPHVDVADLEARSSELLTAIIRGQPTIYTDMLRAERRAVDAAIKAAIRSAWMVAYIKEYVRDTGLASYMGKSNNDEIIAKYDLQPDADGKTINIPLITRIKGNGVRGSQVLDGTEEDLSVYNCVRLAIDWRRPGGSTH